MGLFGNNETVTTTFVGKDNLSPVVRGIRSTMDRFARDAKGGFGLAAGFSVFNMAQRGIGMVTDALGDAMNAAFDEEVSIRKLTTAIEGNVEGWDGNVEAIEKVLAARMRLGFADDEQRESLASLVTVTQDVNKALDIQRTAMDLARLRGMSLADATQLLGKVYSGNIGILSRYGIKVREGADANEALEAVQKRVNGQAVAFAGTAAGKMQAFNVKMGELSEKIGAMVAGPATDLLGFFSDIVDMVSGNDGALNSVNHLTDAFKRQAEAAQQAAEGTSDAAVEFDAFRFMGAIFSEAKFALAGDRLRNVADQLREVGQAAGLTEGQLRELVSNNFGNLTDDKVPEALERMTKVLRNFASERNAFVLSSGDRTGNPLAKLKPPPGTEKAIEGVAAALGFVASRARTSKEAVGNMNRTWRELIRGGDDNKKSIKELTKEIGVWERRQLKALENQDSEAYAFATRELERRKEERRQRRLTIQQMNRHQKELNEEKKRQQAASDAAVTHTEKMRRDEVAIRRARREAEKFNTLPDAYWTAHINFVLGRAGNARHIPLFGNLLEGMEGRGRRPRSGASLGPVSMGGAAAASSAGPQDIVLQVDGEKLFRIQMRRMGREALLAPTG